MSTEMDAILQWVTKTSSDLWTKGWAERNAGNLSVRLRPEETATGADGDWRPIGAKIPGAGGERFLFTSTGSY